MKTNKHDTSKSSTEDLKSDLVAEINELKQLVNDSVPPDNMAAIQTKIDSVRKHIEAL